MKFGLVMNYTYISISDFWLKAKVNNIYNRHGQDGIHR